MYQVDGKDRVEELDLLPPSSVGAPIPTLLQYEHHVLVAYYIEQIDSDWDGKSIRSVNQNSETEVVAVVRFDTSATMFGPPNDEAFHGHPLASRGLRPYRFFEIHNSSWIRSLERMNSVHPNHNEKKFLSRWRHFILSFHDTTFECVALDFELLGTREGSVNSVIHEYLAASMS